MQSFIVCRIFFPLKSLFNRRFINGEERACAVKSPHMHVCLLSAVEILHIKVCRIGGRVVLHSNLSDSDDHSTSRVATVEKHSNRSQNDELCAPGPQLKRADSSGTAPSER